MPDTDGTPMATEQLLARAAHLCARPIASFDDLTSMEIEALLRERESVINHLRRRVDEVELALIEAQNRGIDMDRVKATRG